MLCYNMNFMVKYITTYKMPENGDFYAQRTADPIFTPAIHGITGF